MEKQVSICPANGAVEMQKSMVIFALFNPPMGQLNSTMNQDSHIFFA
jgi:hypothetical protein